MRRHVPLSLPVLAVAIAAGPLTSAAVAAPPSDYSGTYQSVGFTFGEIRGTGSVNHFSATSRSLLTGDVTAESTSQLTCVGYEVPFERSFTCHGTSFDRGQLEGEGFTTTSRISFRCSFETGVCAGRSITYEGTGAFAGIRSVNRFEQNAFTGAGTWSIDIVGR